MYIVMVHNISVMLHHFTPSVKSDEIIQKCCYFWNIINKYGGSNE